MRQPNVPRVPTTNRAAPSLPAARTGPAAARTGGRGSAVRRPAAAAVVLATLAAVAGCGDSGGGSSTASPSLSVTASPSTSGTATATPTASASTSATATASRTTSPTAPVPPPTKPAATCVSRAVTAMSQAQRVGQLFMSAVTSTGITAAESTAITRGKVGSVILITHTSKGVSAVQPATRRAQSLAPKLKGVQVRMLVSTDQEGGQVQVLNGPGFSQIPSAVAQGQWSVSRLQSSAAGWGRQLKAAGVNMNLAPVADTVPADLVNVNAPIGELDREFGTDPSTVATHSTAFLRGMRQAGVVATAKHFPGLGRVRGNTDLTANVVDGTTTRTDPFLQPFRSAVQAGVPFMMITSAIFSRIDPAHQAVFSTAVIRGLLRDSLGFKGAVISDDLGKAVAVSDHTPAQRAVDFIAAGGNLVLTVIPSDIVPMTNAVISRMSSSASFRSAVDDSVRRVLTAKQNAGLLTCS